MASKNTPLNRKRREALAEIAANNPRQNEYLTGSLSCEVPGVKPEDLIGTPYATAADVPAELEAIQNRDLTILPLTSLEEEARAEAAEELTRLSTYRVHVWENHVCKTVAGTPERKAALLAYGEALEGERKAVDAYADLL